MLLRKFELWELTTTKHQLNDLISEWLFFSLKKAGENIVLIKEGQQTISYNRTTENRWNAKWEMWKWVQTLWDSSGSCHFVLSSISTQLGIWIQYLMYLCKCMCARTHPPTQRKNCVVCVRLLSPAVTMHSHGWVLRWTRPLSARIPRRLCVEVKWLSV